MTSSSSDYLNKFLKQTRLKVDAELVNRWQFDARYHGDINIKAQMATARRTATMLQKSIDQFSNMRPEQELAIKAAASAMRTLASELQGIATWAKAYRVFCDAEYKKDRTAALEAIACNRWGNDIDAMNFEQIVMNDLRNEKGRLAFGRWMQERTDCDFKRFAVNHIHEPFCSGWTEGRNPRIELAEKIEEGMRRTSRDVSWDGKHLHCSWADYEAYLAYRNQVAATSKRIVQMATGALES